MSTKLGFDDVRRLPDAILLAKNAEEAESSIYSKNIQNVQDRHRMLITSVEEIELLVRQGIVSMLDGVSVGQVYVRDPFLSNPASFIKSDSNAELHILKDKCIKIMDIAGLLGATAGAFSIRSIETHSFKRVTNADMTVSTVQAKGSHQLEKSYVQEVEQCLSRNWQGVPIVGQDQYDSAVNLATSTGLINNGEIQSLLSSRDPNNINPIKDYSYSFDLTREAHQNIDAAFSVANAGYFQFDATFQKSIQNSVSVRVKVDISFPN